MAYGNVLTTDQMLAQQVVRASHYYWDNRVLQADRFLWSWVNRIEPSTFGGNQHGLAAGDTAITADDLYNLSNDPNAQFQQPQGQTPGGAIGVAIPSAKVIIVRFGMIVGDYFEFSYTNLSGGNVITVSSGAGITDVGLMTIAGGTTARFRVYASNVSAGTYAGQLIRI